MELEQVSNIYNTHIKEIEELTFEIIKKDNFEIAYNKYIKDCYSNFASNFDAKNKKEFENIMNKIEENFKKLNRETVVYLLPTMKELYNNRDKYFDEEYELLSEEVWQIYNNFSNVDNISTNCEFNVSLELATDMNEFADYLVKGYQTGEEDDPYGTLDDGYRVSYANYKKIYDDINIEFYYIKVNDKIVGTTESVYTDEICGICSLAVNKEYRAKGIGKVVLKKQLQMCKDKNIKTAYLQTEEGFYPHKMYKKIGFEDLCTVYYYKKKG